MFADLNIFTILILKPCDLEKYFSFCLTCFLKLQSAKLFSNSLYLLGALGMLEMMVTMVIQMSSTTREHSKEEDKTSHADVKKMID